MLVRMPRFTLLEHTGAPDDPVGRHFDLLLEDGVACRTWRLMEIPQAGGSAVAALELPPHRLAWLDIRESAISGGRGRARRMDAGEYEVVSIQPGALDKVQLDALGHDRWELVAIRAGDGLDQMVFKRERR